MAHEVDFTGHRVRPANVLRAILKGDKELLSELGRRGAANRQRLRVARKAQQNREMEKMVREDAAIAAFRNELIAEDDARYFLRLHHECNYDICPID